MIKSIFSDKKKKTRNKLISVFLTVFVVGLLVLSGPARAINVSVAVDDSDAKYSANQLITFTASVDIESNEIIPVQNLTLKVYNDSSQVASCTFDLAGNKLTACTNFPNITKINAKGYVNATGQFGYGYGYNSGNWNVSNQSFFNFTGYGYGYGYTSGYGSNNAELKYNVTWNASAENLSTSAPTGDDYYANLEAYADDSSGSYRIYSNKTRTSFIYDNYLPNITAINTSQTGTTTKIVSLSVTTSENATCGYSTSAGYVYSNMTTNMSTTGTTSHSQSFSYTSDTTKTYYVSCQDTAGNAMTTSNSTPATIDVTESSSPGSSGGGSGIIPFWIMTYVDDDKNLDEKGLINRELKAKERIKLEINNETHYVGIIELTNTTATINVSSEPQQAIFSIGDTKKFEVTGDDYYDLSVTLNSINTTSNKADITIKPVSGEIVIPEEAGEEDIVEGDGEEGDKSNWWWITLIIILALVAIYFIAIKLKPKK